MWKVMEQNRWNSDDLDNMAKVLAAPGYAQEKVKRFFEVGNAMPAFLLAELVCSCSIHSVQLLKKVIDYVQEKVLSDLHLTGRLEPYQLDRRKTREIRFSIIRNGAHVMDEVMLLHLFKALARHAQNISPPALVPIGDMCREYLIFAIKQMASQPEEERFQGLRRYRITINQLVQKFGEPAREEPYRSTVYQWSAQKSMLQVAQYFDPPLVLDRNTYIVVASVLNASIKNSKETKSAALRVRTWPPWRFDQDGVDAQRSPEDDQSRSLQVVLRALESGYGPNHQQIKALGILGGREADGSPTIHTRRFIGPVYERKTNAFPEDMVDEATARTWSARVTATRDVQEAWSIFQEFCDKGGHPSRALYRAMFEKLHADKLRTRQGRDGQDVPGNPLRVMAPADAGYSESYRLKKQAPSIEWLYEDMRNRNLRPYGALLVDLVKQAKTLTTAVQYLRDSGFDNDILEYLTGHSEQPPPNIFSKMSFSLLWAWLNMLGRFVGRVATPKSLEGREAVVPSYFGIRKSTGLTGRAAENTLLHMLHLVHETKPRYKPIWNQLFSALARPLVIVSDEPFSVVHEFDHDIKAWDILRHSLSEFQSMGMELDVTGFGILIRGATKYLVACQGEARNVPADWVQRMDIVTEEWNKIVAMNGSDADTPHYYAIGSVLLHRYLRLLGRAGLIEQMANVLEWMSCTHKQLYEHCRSTSNGFTVLRNCFAAARFFGEGTSVEPRLRDIFARKHVDWWEGWPSDEHMRTYDQHAAQAVRWIPGR